MLKKSKVLLILILFSLVLPFITPIAEIAYAGRPRYDDGQTFYLPIVEDEGISTKSETFSLLSDERSSHVGEYDFGGDKVNVYINPEQRYPILGRVPIIIRLVAGGYDTLDNVDYTVTLKSGDDEYTSQDLVMEYGNHRDDEGNWSWAKYILAYFPDTVTEGDYEISLEVRDNSSVLYKDIESKKDEIIEEFEEVEEELPEEIIEEVEEVEEEDEEKVETFMEEEIDSPIIEVEELADDDGELIDPDPIEDMVEVDEPIETEETEEIEEINTEVEDLPLESTDFAFKTDFVPIRLTWEDIIQTNEIVIDRHNPRIYVENLGNGKVEAKVLDDKGNMVYTTNDRIGYNHGLHESGYYIGDPFYTLEDYYVYNGDIELFKADDITVGSHRLILTLDGEEIYEKEIEMVEKYPVVDDVEIDKYLLAGDREFKLRVRGEYINKKDLLDLQLVDSENNVIAHTIESHYMNIDNEGVYSQVLYTMEVESNQEINAHEEYMVKLEYKGPEELVVRAEHISIYSTTGPKIYGTDLSRSHKGEVILEGVNFDEDDEYMAEVRYENEILGEYLISYISPSELSLDIGGRLNRGSYYIEVYRRVDGDYKDYVGYAHFYYYEDMEGSSGSPELGYSNPEVISPSEGSYSGDIYIRNFIADNQGDIEISLVDSDGNIVGQAEIHEYHSNSADSWTYFKMNVTEPLSEGSYYYVYKYEGKEIKNINNERLLVSSTNKAVVDWLEIKGSLYNEIIGLDKEIEFTLINGLNIKDLSQLDVYIGGLNDKKIASLASDTLKEVEEYGRLNYTGKLSFIDTNMDDEEAEIFVTYDGRTIYRRNVMITSKPYIDKFRTDRAISSYSGEYNITLNRTINVNPEKMRIEIYDLKGNEVEVLAKEIDEWTESKLSEIKNFDISFKIDEDLKDAYYELYVYNEDIDITEEFGSSEKGFYATKKPILTGTTHSSTYENDDIIMNLTGFTQVLNIDSGQDYKGYFYLRGDNYDDLEFTGSVDLVSGEKYGTTGILIPSEEFIDYPVGQYELIIEKSSGELLGRSHFRIYWKDKNIVDPDDPGMEEKQAPTADHSWTVEFNKEVDPTSVNSRDVYIIDESRNKLDFIYPKAEGKNIILNNEGEFVKGKRYTLVISEIVKSMEGESLNKAITMKFTVK